MLPNLPTGPYRSEAMLQGFRTSEQTGIVLRVATAPVINVVLAGAAVQTGVVSARNVPGGVNTSVATRCASLSELSTNAIEPVKLRVLRIS